MRRYWIFGIEWDEFWWYNFIKWFDTSKQIKQFVRTLIDAIDERYNQYMFYVLTVTQQADLKIKKFKNHYLCCRLHTGLCSWKVKEIHVYANLYIRLPTSFLRSFIKPWKVYYIFPKTWDELKFEIRFVRKNWLQLSNTIPHFPLIV